MNVLVAEDNHFTANQYNTALKSHGYDVTITHDGNECLQMYDSANFDVILLDNNMPQKNGIEVAKSILEKNPDQRIIFASAYDIDALKQASENIKKSVEVLEKPFSLNSMLKKIENRS